MKRAALVHFLAIINDEYISIRASCALKEINYFEQNEKIGPRKPHNSFYQLSRYRSEIKLIGLGQTQEVVFEKVYDSDKFGNFFFKIPLNEKTRAIENFQVYETKLYPSIELALGSFLPLRIDSEKKIIISDFDKTLVDTRYSKFKEVYNSLTNPIENFPTVTKSVELFHSYLKNGYAPFILSASPHFYEESMRDWLYRHHIFTAPLFLKDYRQVLSPLENELTPKDITTQGLYKLNHLLDILNMTGVPKKLCLMGDNFESDPQIYLSLRELLLGSVEPWQMWNRLKKLEAFKLNQKQDALFLGKIYQLKTAISRSHHKPEIEIYIRKRDNDEKLKLPEHFLSEHHTVKLYQAGSREKISGSKKEDISNTKN